MLPWTRGSWKYLRNSIPGYISRNRDSGALAEAFSAKFADGNHPRPHRKIPPAIAFPCCINLHIS